MGSIESDIVAVARSGMLSPVSRRVFLGLAGAAGITGLAACAGSPTPTPGGSAGASAGVVTEKTWCQVTTLANDFFVLFDQGAQQATKALGVEMSTFEDGADVNKAVGQVGTVKASGGKSIFGTPATEAEAAAVTKACQAAGILYGSSYTAPAWYTPADADKWIRFISPLSTKIAEVTAKMLFDAVGGSGTIIHVPGAKGSSADNQRTAGFNKALQAYPNIKVVTTSPGNWTSEDARTAFQNVLPKVPQFAGVFAQNDSEAAGVIAAMQAAGITGKPVTGFDGNKQNIQFIAEGKQLTTSATIGGLTAGLLAVTIFDALNGVEFSLPERFLAQGALMVDKSIASDVLSSIYGAQLPFDWKKMSMALSKDAWDPQTLLVPIDPKEYFAGLPQDQYTLNSAWGSADLQSVATKYTDAFKSGPLFQYKAKLVA